MTTQLSFETFCALEFAGRYLSFERSRAEIKNSAEKAPIVDGPIAEVRREGTIVYFRCEWLAIPVAEGVGAWKRIECSLAPIDLLGWMIVYETDHPDSRIRLTCLADENENVSARRRIFIEPPGREIPKRSQLVE